MVGKVVVHKFVSIDVPHCCGAACGHQRVVTRQKFMYVHQARGRQTASRAPTPTAERDTQGERDLLRVYLASVPLALFHPHTTTSGG